MAHNLGGAGLAGEVDALEMGKGGGAGDGGRGHGVGDDLPGVGGHRDGLVAGARKGLVDGFELFGRNLVGKDDVRAAEDAARGDAADGAGELDRGVTVTAPCPMPTEMVSPANHLSCA